MIITRDGAYRFLCSLRTPNITGGEQVGTGMFVVRGDDLFIITASHVARNINPSSSVILCDSSGAPVKISLASLVAGCAWKHHPVADISVIQLQIDPANQLLQNRFFPYDHMDLTSIAPSRDIELTVLGFPLGLGTVGKFSPLSYRTYAASSLITLPRADTRAPSVFFCLENPSVGGYSGGPVFDLGYMIVGLMTQQKEKTMCHGFMHGTLSDDTGGKLALVTPSCYLSGWL